MSPGQRKGILFIISAPSGAGKTSLARALLEGVSGLRGSVSHTTRAPRKNEQHGRDYHFVSEEQFRSLVARDNFLEYARVFEHYYGTSRTWVEEQLAAGMDVILDIDWQGAQQARARIRDTVSVFILPPALAVLRTRLQGRGDEPDNIRRRMREAVSEIERYRDYDYLLVNDDFDQTLERLAGIVQAARHSCARHRKRHEELVTRLLQSA